jgi:glycosyltransferase involved in cell wall biosynthesis
MDSPEGSGVSALTVVIATRNRAQILAGSLLALTQQDFTDFEVIVADNGSTDATPAVCETFTKLLPNLRLIRDPRPGQLVGWHRGLAVAQGEITAFIDDDVRPRPSWAGAVCVAFADPAVGLATGPIAPMFETPPPAWQRAMVLEHEGGTWSALWGALDFGTTAKEIKADFVWGSNFLARRDALIAVGGFHPGGMPKTLFRFTGDGDVAAGRRIASTGLKVVYTPDAAVDHLMTSARNEPGEVERWITGEGIVTSYLLMRRLAARHPRLPSAELMRYVDDEFPEDKVSEIGRGYLRRRLPLPDHLRTIFETAGSAGFRLHQAAFAADAAFRDWVLRANYLDLDACYTHPELVGYSD